MAKTTQTVVHHITGKRFLGVTPNTQRVMIDGEAQAKTGMNPTELLLSALGACAAFDIVAMIEKRRLELRGYRIEITGERFDGTPAYFTNIHSKHIFDVPGLSEKMATRFVDLGLNSYCSVGASLKAELSFEVVLEHGEAES